MKRTNPLLQKYLDEGFNLEFVDGKHVRVTKIVEIKGAKQVSGNPDTIDLPKSEAVFKSDLPFVFNGITIDIAQIRDYELFTFFRDYPNTESAVIHFHIKTKENIEIIIKTEDKEEKKVLCDLWELLESR